MTPEQKILCILEKLKEEWDLTPKKNDEPMVQSGFIAYYRKTGTKRIPMQRFSAWERECGVKDWYELEDILAILKQDGLISNFGLHSEYE